MKIELDFQPVFQTGHNCKPVAIAAVEQYYAKQLGYQPIPLHKRSTSSSFSIRQIAKYNGSLQGEMLELRQLQQTLMDIGFDTEVVDCQENPELFEEKIRASLLQGDIPIACFAVNRWNGLPTTVVDDNEHAAIVTGIEGKKIQITHWNKHYITTLDALYRSLMALPDQRKPEYYVPLPLNKIKKYELIHSEKSSPHIRKTVVPEEGTGFRGKLIIVKRPNLDSLNKRREELEEKILLIRQVEQVCLQLRALANELKKFESEAAIRVHDNLQTNIKKLSIAVATFKKDKEQEPFISACKGAAQTAYSVIAKERHELKNNLAFNQIFCDIACLLVSLLSLGVANLCSKIVTGSFTFFQYEKAAISQLDSTSSTLTKFVL
jgi:hypothetical protein